MKKLIKSLLLLAVLLVPYKATAGTVIKYIQSSTTTQVGSVIHQSSGTIDQFRATAATFTSVNLTVNANTANQVPRYSQTKLLQSVDNAISASSATSSATLGKTNITVTINVISASSKINLMAAFSGSNSAIQNNCEYKITKGGGNITNTNTVNFGSSGVATGSLQYGMMVLGSDSPATTGNVTYEVSFRNLSGGITCTVGGSSSPAYIRADEINGL